jgi:hypothetical protein
MKNEAAEAAAIQKRNGTMLRIDFHIKDYFSIMANISAKAAIVDIGNNTY